MFTAAPGLEIKAPSGGPRTPEGKAVSALNGETHGFTSARISPKNARGVKLMEARRAELSASFRPANGFESDLIERMATARAKQALIEETQAAMEEAGQLETRLYENLHRYWKDAERSYFRSLAALQQTRRQAQTESHARHREETVYANTRNKVGEKIYSRERKKAEQGGKSVFDEPNYREVLVERIRTALDAVPAPPHLRNADAEAA